MSCVLTCRRQLWQPAALPVLAARNTQQQLDAPQEPGSSHAPARPSALTSCRTNEHHEGPAALRNHTTQLTQGAGTGPGHGACSGCGTR